jgi:acetyl-CoA carboxylase carboxyl transferase subunit alpha
MGEIQRVVIFDTMVQMAEQEAGKLAHVQAGAAAMPEAWRRTELARHPERPYPMDFIEALFTDFSEIHGDRAAGWPFSIAGR